MAEPTVAVALPAGFRAAGVHCGIKADPQKLDLALFVSDRPCVSAGVFTQNRVCGAPVKVSRQRVGRGATRGVIINSGNANACTGERGLDDARWMTSEAAALLGCGPDDVLVCSTGVIGRFLPRDKLGAGIPVAAQRLSADSAAFEQAARAMMTTDTFSKLAGRRVETAGGAIHIAGCAKGAAMIGPNMATMLAVIMTDAALTTEQADAMLRHAAARSFNCISVDGHTSTSDTVLLLANGEGQADTVPGEEMQCALDEVASELAQLIIRDAEGADHFITVDVRGTRTREEAIRIARAVADSPLVKTAIAGGDPNWGRIVSAAGYCGVDLREEDLTLRLNGTLLYRSGAPVEFDAVAVSRRLREGRDVQIELVLPLGSEAARFWTSDLTAEYVRLNADYTT